ncbi:MAG: efflux RND transporter periplasmic adaptor subunit [Pseudomonadota bacterium]|nr:efflux RND transporter periplasmic adaptor subunit [Pseudomonadota bacterium]
MNNGLKLTLGVVVLVGLGLVQWKYNVVGQLGSQSQNAIATTQVPTSAGPKGAAPVQLVKLAKASKADFPLIERGYGTMASPQVVGINARITSQITKVNVQDGQMVKAGDILIELDDRTIQTTLAKDVATLAKDQAVLANNDIQLQRARTLASRNAGPLQDVDNAIAAQSSQMQIIDSDKAVIDADKLQLDFTKIRAPFDGKLGAISAVIGALVSPPGNSGTQSSLLTITQMQPLRVIFRLAEQVLTPLQAALAKNPDSAIVRVYASSSKNELDEGKLNFIDSSVDPTSGTIGLAANIGNAKLNLWPGQRVSVDLEYGITLGAITVPTVAVQQGQIGSFVWVVDDQNKAKATPVKVSRFEGELASISDGLTEGAQVVVEGQAKLSNGAEVRAGGGKPADANAKPADATAAATDPTKKTK